MKALANVEPTRLNHILDALRYSLELEKKAYHSLSRAFRKIEASDDDKGHPNHTLALNAFSNAWSILDTAHRIRGLITQVPALSQRTPDIQVFIRSTLAVEGFRHLYQHLNSEIPKVKGTTNPIMGVLSWVTKNPSNSITIFLGTGTNETRVHTVSLDTWTGRFAHNLLFSAGNKDIELDQVHSRCRALSKILDKWLVSKAMLSTESAKVSVIRFHIRIE